MPDSRPVEIPAEDRFPGWPRVGGGSGDAPAAPAPASPDAPAPDAGAAAGGEPSDTPVDIEAAAAAFEAEAIAALEDQPQPPPGGGKEDGSGKGEGAARAPAAPDPLDTFIQQNYGGDKSAFVASLHESRKEARRLSDEVAVLKASQPTTTRDVEAEYKAERDSSTEVQAVDHEIKTIDAKSVAIRDRQSKIVGLVESINSQIIELEATLPTIDDTKELTKGQAKLMRARVEVSNLYSEFNTNEARSEQLGLQRAHRTRELARLESGIRQSMVAREEQQRTDVVNGQRTRQAFGAAFDASIKDYGLEPASDTYIYLQNATRTQLADYLDSLGDEADGLDTAQIFDAVNRLVSLGAKAFKLQPRSAAPAKPRTPITPRPILTPKVQSRPGEPPARPSARPSSKEALENDPEYWRNRATKVFEAVGREAQRRGGRGLG